jgi:hypothetical protein
MSEAQSTLAEEARSHRGLAALLAALTRCGY